MACPTSVKIDKPKFGVFACVFACVFERSNTVKLQTPNSKLQTPNSKLQTCHSNTRLLSKSCDSTTVKTGLNVSPFSNPSAPGGICKERDVLRLIRDFDDVGGICSVPAPLLAA
jgi:hypothetical protein